MSLDKQVKINSCAKVVCSKEWRWNVANNSKWNDYDLWFVISGKGKLSTNNMNFDVFAGSCFILNPLTIPVASQDINHPLTVIYVHFDYYSNGKIIYPKNVPLYRHLFNVNHIHFMLEKAVTNFASNRNEEANAWLTAVLMEISDQDKFLGESDNNQHYKSINEICHNIIENPHHDHSLNDYATHYNYSYDYMGRLFKTYTGISFSGFCINARVNKAKILLKTTDKTVSEISCNLGYNDMSLFYRQFKNKVKMTPSEFRKAGL